MRLRSLALVSIIIGSVGLPAVAEAAYTTGNVNLRQGPGTAFYAYTTLGPGTRVRILTCQPSWCQVRTQGMLGWVSSSYIAGGQGYHRGSPPPPMMYPQPPGRYFPPPPGGPYMGPPPGYGPPPPWQKPYMGGPRLGPPPGY